MSRDNNPTDDTRDPNVSSREPIRPIIKEPQASNPEGQEPLNTVSAKAVGAGAGPHPKNKERAEIVEEEAMVAETVTIGQHEFPIYERDKYYEGRCNRLHALFLHYSTVRMTILSFLVPLGGVLIGAQNNRAAGSWVIIVAYVMNVFFGMKSIDRWLKQRNIDLWLYIGNKNLPYVQLKTLEKFPQYLKFVFCKFSMEAYCTDGYAKHWIDDWEKRWKKIYEAAQKTERLIQISILIGIGIYCAFLFNLGGIRELVSPANDATTKKDAIGNEGRNDTTNEDLIHSLREDVEKGKVQVEQLHDRLTITLIDRILFDSGRTEIKPAGAQVLARISAILRTAKDKQVRVEGHTDNVSIGPRIQERFPTNWELSSARSSSIVRFLIDKQGIDPSRLSVAGYAQYRPRGNNDTEVGRSANRRIEIVLHSQEQLETHQQN